MAEALTITLRVNGEDHRVETAAHHTLLEVLRDQVKLLSVREGCGIGMCGACTVLVDGKPISACLTLAAMAEDHEITTIEGLGSAEDLHPIQAAFVERTGFQCSYCTPGILLSTKALLDERPDATDEAIREYLSGNLCRCGSYVKILDSVHAAIDRLKAEAR